MVMYTVNKPGKVFFHTIFIVPDKLKEKVAVGGGGGASVFVPMISICIGLPSSSTLLYLLTAARASDLLEKTTSADCSSLPTVRDSNYSEFEADEIEKSKEHGNQNSEATYSYL